MSLKNSRQTLLSASKFRCASPCFAVIAVDEGDIGRYTIKAALDPRAANKTVRLEPPKNAVTQAELIALCEKLKGKTYKKRDATPEMLVEEYKSEWMRIVKPSNHNPRFLESPLTGDFDL